MEVLGHLNGNGKNRFVAAYSCVIYPFLLAEDQKKKENRRIAEADGMKEQVSPQIMTTKEEKSGYFWEKNAGCVENPAGAAAFSAVFNMIFLGIKEKKKKKKKKRRFSWECCILQCKRFDDWAGS